MHQLLKDVKFYFHDLGISAIRAWDRFFFTPADPTTLGLIRILLGSLFFWDIAVLGLDLRDYLGSDGWIGPEAVKQYLAEHAPHAWSLWFYVPDSWLAPVWMICLIVAFLFAIGFVTRITAVMAWAIAISTVRRAPVALFGFDYMIATWLFYLAVFGASGQGLSVDRFLESRRRSARGASLRRQPYGTCAVDLDQPDDSRPSITSGLHLRGGWALQTDGNRMVERNSDTDDYAHTGVQAIRPREAGSLPWTPEYGDARRAFPRDLLPRSYLGS